MTLVALLGDGADAAADLVRDAGGDALTGRDALDAAADAAVAFGEDALLDAVDAGADAPVLPVDAGEEYGGVSRAALPKAVSALVDGDFDVRERATLAVRVGERSFRALADAMLVTNEPARISEYEIRAGEGGVEAGPTGAALAGPTRTVDEVRADGVVAATPAGSHGYAAAAGGPLLSADANALSVVPVAPFRVEQVHWVLSPPLSVTVTREETEVGLFVDGRERGVAPAHDTVVLAWGDPVPVAAVPGVSAAPGFED